MPSLPRFVVPAALGLLAAAVGPAAAKGKGLPATLACTTAKGEALPLKDKARLGEPLTCVLTLDAERTLTGTITARGKQKTGPGHSGDAAKDAPFKTELAPGTDFELCADFDIEAQLQDETGKALWVKKLAVKQDCRVKKVKAQVACSVRRGGKNVPLPARGNPRLDLAFGCALTTRDGAAASHTPIVRVAQPGREPSRKEGSVIAETDTFNATFELAPATDYDVCGGPLTLTFELVTAEGATAFSKVVTLKQQCPG